MALENGKKSLACLTIQGVQDQIQFQTALSQKLWKLDHTLVKPNCVWKIYFFSQHLELFAYNKYEFMKNELYFQSCLCGLVDKRLDCYAKGPGFKTHPGPFRKCTFIETSYFFQFFQTSNSTRKNVYLSNTFWLYQCMV